MKADEKEKISVAKLLQQSAKQIWYLRMKKALYSKPTENQLKGIEYQERVSISEYKEMRGCYPSDKYLLFFSFDEVFVNKHHVIFKEHKNVHDSYEQWYFHYMLLQCAMYNQLAKMINPKVLHTAKFFQKQGFKANHLDYSGKDILSILSIGENKFYDVAGTSDKLVHYFLNKLDATETMESAMLWDEKNKFKDWDNVRKYIIYVQLTEPEVRLAIKG